jgi:hypothetical protein
VDQKSLILLTKKIFDIKDIDPIILQLIIYEYKSLKPLQNQKTYQTPEERGW